MWKGNAFLWPNVTIGWEMSVRMFWSDGKFELQPGRSSWTEDHSPLSRHLERRASQLRDNNITEMIKWILARLPAALREMSLHSQKQDPSQQSSLKWMQSNSFSHYFEGTVSTLSLVIRSMLVFTFADSFPAIPWLLNSTKKGV